MASSRWRSSGTSLFHGIQGDWRRHFLCHVSLTSVKWQGGTQTCLYCGGQYNGSICPGCQSRQGEHHALGKAVLTLESHMPGPAAELMFDMPQHTILELTHRCCGRRDEYEKQDVIMRFWHCEVVGRQMNDLCAGCPDQEAMLSLIAEIECSVELIPGGGQQ